MASRKQTITFNGAMLKGKAINAIGEWSPRLLSISHMLPRTLAPPSIRGQTSTFEHPRRSTKTKFFRFLPILKCRWSSKPRAALDRKNAICEQEALRQLNVQLQTKIAALQNTQTPTQSESEPEIKESSDIRVLDELIQRRIEEAKLQLHSRSVLSAAKVSDPLSEEILE